MAKRTKADGVSRRAALAVGFGGLSAAACANEDRSTRYEGVIAFRHGVAAGDPGQDRLVIWTRVTPSVEGPVPVRWVVASDRDLRQVAAEGEFTTDANRDYTVKVDAGGLKPGKTYYYGFYAGAAQSPTGKAKTLPKGTPGSVTFAVVSCANFPFGFFNAYKAVAETPDLDAVIHLGDYIYEYGPDGYGGEVGAKIGRPHAPAKEIVTLADYRTRHAQYKEDPDLQAAHAAAAFIVTWDDHETTNDSWADGAENHQEERGEGTWPSRKDVALQAYYEWMPIRDPAPGGAFEAINRSFAWGDLARLIMLETRLLARTKQLDYGRDLQLISTAWDFANPAAPIPLVSGAALTPTVRVLPTPFDVTGDAPRPILDWKRVSTLDPRSPPPGVAFLPDIEGFTATRLRDPSRALLGEAQEAWLQAELGKAKDAAWRILGNQTLMAKVNAPDFSAMPEAAIATLEQASPGIRQMILNSRFGLPVNLDQWDGYPVQRERLYQMLKSVGGGGTIVITGDTHVAWANELYTEDGQTRAAVEFGTTSVTSPGLGAQLPGVDIAGAITRKNPEVRWLDPDSKGFVVLTLKRGEALAEFFEVSDILGRDFTTAKIASFRVEPEAGGTGALEPISG